MAVDLPDWAQPLLQGAADPGSPWRNLALGTLGLDGTPQIRTVVLRRASGRMLDVHTDTRSAKYAELLATPLATLHGWDASSRIQLRASGGVHLHVADAEAGEAWASLRAPTRAIYRVRPGPGTRLAEPDQPAQDATDADAWRVFCVIRLTVQSVDWLHLADLGHRRARFTWPGGIEAAAWIAP